jgi:hypothetical protein
VGRTQVRTNCVRLSLHTGTGIDFWLSRTLRDLGLWIDTVNRESGNGKQNL